MASAVIPMISSTCRLEESSLVASAIAQPASRVRMTSFSGHQQRIQWRNATWHQIHPQIGFSSSSNHIARRRNLVSKSNSFYQRAGVEHRSASAEANAVVRGCHHDDQVGRQSCWSHQTSGGIGVPFTTSQPRARSLHRRRILRVAAAEWNPFSSPLDDLEAPSNGAAVRSMGGIIDVELIKDDDEEVNEHNGKSSHQFPPEEPREEKADKASVNLGPTTGGLSNGANSGGFPNLSSNVGAVNGRARNGEMNGLVRMSSLEKGGGLGGEQAQRDEKGGGQKEKVQTGKPTKEEKAFWKLLEKELSIFLMLDADEEKDEDEDNDNDELPGYQQRFDARKAVRMAAAKFQQADDLDLWRVALKLRDLLDKPVLDTKKGTALLLEMNDKMGIDSVEEAFEEMAAAFGEAMQEEMEESIKGRFPSSSSPFSRSGESAFRTTSGASKRKAAGGSLSGSVKTNEDGEMPVRYRHQQQRKQQEMDRLQLEFKTGFISKIHPRFQKGSEQSFKVPNPVQPGSKSREGFFEAPVPTDADSADIVELKRELNFLVTDAAGLAAEGKVTAVEELLDANLEAVEEQLRGAVVGVEQAFMLHCLSGIAMKMGSQGAKDLVNKTAEVTMRLEAEHPSLWEVLFELGNNYTDLELLPEARQFYELSDKALADKEETLTIVKQRSWTLQSLAAMCIKTDDKPGALSALQRLLAMWERGAGEESPSVAMCLRHIGALLTQMGSLDEARRTFNRAANITSALEGARGPNWGVQLIYDGDLEQKCGNISKAIGLWQKGLQVIDEQPFEERDLELYDATCENLIGLFEKMARIPDLQETMEKRLAAFEARILKREEAHAGPPRETVRDSDSSASVIVLALLYLNMANHYIERGMWARAVGVLHRMECHVDKYDVLEEKYRLMMFKFLTACYEKSGELKSAEKYARAFFNSASESASPDRSAHLIHAASSLATILERQGRLQEAEKLFLRNLMSIERERGSDHPDFAVAASMVLNVASKMGGRTHLVQSLQAQVDRILEAHPELLEGS
eukprot:TRINITY_DN436_c0_g1_i1.p1 TRINITY_DN436_c0_g1~~TRINITY_DN436_c0_g1_i1.p1  ORF type:complete len:1027 (+),score=188.07 TRINITY_DN436_c0_g1_i1:304-3384(+)